MTDSLASDSPGTTPPQLAWFPWRVAPASGFEVQNPEGSVGLIQETETDFFVELPFRFTNAAVTTMLTDRLVRNGKSAEMARQAVEDARTFTPTTENPTDLASVPRYLRWFESAYGLHTLAAIIHDNLIVGTPNDGALGDDTLSDRFFREMMRSAGVPWLKRWIMWSAVALRTRWAVGGWRRLSVLAWVLLSALGITCFVWAIGLAAGAWDGPFDAWPMLAAALVLPFLAACLWGKQYGAGILAAIAALWILPAAALAGAGYLVYRGLEWAAGRVGLD